MNETLENIKNQITQFWNNLSRGQKITFSLILGLFLIGSTVMFAMFMRTDYTEVARDLDPRDASEMVEMIENMGVSYRLEDGGTRILVPQEDHDQVRLQLAGAGLPKGGVLGYEDLDTAQLGLTESERELRQKIALEGELVRTIRRYPEVDDARVHLVKPERTLFEEIEEDAKAAVFLDLTPGRELDQDQIRSVVNLVAHSVEGLNPENVTLTSGQQILSDQIRKAEDRVTGEEVRDRLGIQEEFQTTLQTSVETMLEDILGPGNVTARVTAELDFDEFSTFSELFEPVEDGEGILVSMHEEEEMYSGEGFGPMGVPGDPAVGVPEYPEEFEGGEFDYERSQETRNYEVNRIEEHHRVAPGAVERLTVSVAVDDDLDEEQMASIENLVEDAVGLEMDRDQITVEQMDFDRTLQEMMADQLEREQEIAARQRMFLIGGIVVAAILLFIIGRKIYRGMQERRAVRERMEQERTAQEQVAAQEPEEPQVQKQLSDFAQKNPEEFAKVLRAWLAEE